MAKRVRKSKNNELEEGVIRWKKIGGGSLRLPNHIIKPNQIFTARKDEIPENFFNSLEPLDDIPEDEIEKDEPPVSKYTLKERGNNWFDVVNEDGKPLNEKALRKDQADELLESL